MKLALLTTGAALLAVSSMSGHVEAVRAAERQGCPAISDAEVRLTGGPIRIGNDRGYTEERPAYDTQIDGFGIDRHEVTNRQFAAFVAATGHVTRAEREGRSVVFDPPGGNEVPVDPARWWKIVAGADWRHPEGPDSDLNGRGELPVVHVSYADARAYAEWAGRALPSEEQFEYAARAGSAETMDQPGADSANTWQGRFPVRNDGDDGHARLAPVGCYKPNAFGLNDMIGNVWEWTGSWYLPTRGVITGPGGTPGNPSFDPTQPDARARVIKGGSFLCAPNYCARYRPAARHAQDELSGASHLGFRTVSRDHRRPTS